MAGSEGEMIIVNAGFGRKIKDKGHRQKWQGKNVRGIKIDMSWNDDHALIRKEIMKHRPKGVGWALEGYAQVWLRDARGRFAKEAAR